MTGPLVSIIIPVYNVEQYLMECLDSVFNQTYRNIEVIAVNDGSTDGSANILKNYEKKYDNIIVHNQENAGNSVARNKGLHLAKGKYVYFLDSDDFIERETINNLVTAMEKYSLDLIRFAAEPFLDGVEYKNFNKHLYDYSKFFESGRVYKKDEFLKANIKGFSPSPCLYLIKRNLLIENNILFKPKMLHEDELFSLLIYLNTNRAMYDGNFYYKRRYRPGSIMTSQVQAESNKKSFDSYVRLTEEIAELLPKYKNKAERDLLKSRLRSIYIGLRTKDVDMQYKRKKLSELSGLGTLEKIYTYYTYQTRQWIKKQLNFRLTVSR
jgi:glycosyltransferase involved in cell wall biosynthesis